MTEFYKLSGAGNDFIALVEPARTPEGAEIRAWCRRALSLGADGLFLLSRQDSQAPESAVRMIHFNADGGRSDLCLNGSRCAVQLAFHLGWARQGSEMTLVTDAGRLIGRQLSASETQISIPPTLRDRPAPCILKLDGRRFEGWLVRVGVPHFVVPSPAALDSLDLTTLGPALRHHPDLQPNGANIDFIAVDGQDQVAMRTFERGVEAETLACGTGAIACFLAGFEAGFLESPARVETAGGFPLTVTGEASRSGRLDLAGDARLVAKGSLCAGAEAQPQPPVWSRSVK